MTPAHRPAYRSYSQLETWSTCAEKYRLSYIVKVPEEPAVWNVGGTAFHTCAELIMREELPDFNERSFQLMWATAWNKAYTEVLERNSDVNPDMSTWRRAGRVSKDKPNKEDHVWWQQAGLDMVRRFAEWRVIGSGSSLQVYEHGDQPLLETQLMPLFDGVPVKAFPDAVVVDEHGQVHVLDYKTGSRVPDNGGLQLGVYKAALKEVLDVDITYGLYYMARDALLAEPKDLRHWTVERITHLFTTFDAQEKAGQYLPSMGMHCGYCSYKPHCVYQGGTDPDERDTPLWQ